MSSTILFYNTSVSYVLQVWHRNTSACCVLKIPREDYNSFKRELTNSLDADVPDLEELVNIKWDKYGQKFLHLCIAQKAGTLRSFPNRFSILLQELIEL